VISDVDTESGERLAREIGPATRFKRHDVSQESEWQRIIGETVSELGRLDVLVNNAAIADVGNIETQTAEQWRRVNAVISDGAFFGCKHAVLAMKASGGTIVNVSSVASFQGEPYVVAYSAAKGAVEALTRSVAVHCAQLKIPIRCNSLHPGPIQTPMVEEMSKRFKEAVKEGMQLPPGLTSPSYRAAPEDIATSVLYLASDASKWVNGARLVVDHTMSVTRGTVPV
jgi:3(or 17)beta-hydroxysteroid dehydrogenase